MTATIIPFPIVSIKPLSAIDLVKSIAKLTDGYDALKNVMTANEFLKIMYPHTTAGKLQAFNPDF